jgi:hypothetical protein
MNLRRLLGLCGAAMLLLGGVASAAGPELRGSVGPGFTILLADTSGNPVTHLDPGAFSLTVDDKAADHNFHLMGAGVDITTTVDEVAVKTFSLNLVDGKYTFICDAHPTSMAGSFTVGTSPPEAPPPPPPPSPVTSPTRLVITLTGTTISLTTPAGKPVKALNSGSALVTVRDRSAARGAQLSGAGIRRSTSASFVGTVVWKVKLSPGTLVYASNGKKPVLRGARVKVS